MPGWIDLKFWMAVCWKMSWNDDPLPLSVPLRLPDEPPPLVVDELQAARPKAAATRAAPAAAPWMRARCISDIPSQLPANVVTRIAFVVWGRFRPGQRKCRQCRLEDLVVYLDAADLHH